MSHVSNGTHRHSVRLRRRIKAPFVVLIAAASVGSGAFYSTPSAVASQSSNVVAKSPSSARVASLPAGTVLCAQVSGKASRNAVCSGGSSSAPPTQIGSAVPTGQTQCATANGKVSHAASCSATGSSSAKPVIGVPAGQKPCPNVANKRSFNASCRPGSGGSVSPLDQPTYSISLTASSTQVTLPATSTLTATSSVDVGPTPYLIIIYNTATGSSIASCGTGTTCSTTVTNSQNVSVTYGAVIGSGTTAPFNSVQASASTVTVSFAWQFNLALTPSSSTVYMPARLTLTATTSTDVGPTPYVIVIVDQASGSTVASCGSGTSCSTSVSVGSPTTKSYEAFVSASTSPPSNVQASTPPISITFQWEPFNPRISGSPMAVQLPGSSTITATTTNDVGPTPFLIYIIDESTGTVLASCGNGTSCSTSFTIGAQGEDTIEAAVAQSSPPSLTNLQGTSSPIVVSFSFNFQLSLTVSGSTLTATTNVDVGPTPWFIEMYDADSNTRVSYCGSGKTCSGSMNPGDNDYVAYVGVLSTTAPPSSIEAMATPTDKATNLENVPANEGEFETYNPTGDPKDQSFALTGDAYRDALRFEALFLWRSAHATAVSLRAEDAVQDYPGYTVRADFSGLSVLNTLNLAGTQAVAGAGSGGGPGLPDITASNGTDMNIWEVKHDSDTGRLLGMQQVGGYVTKALQDPNFSSFSGINFGPPFGYDSTAPTPDGLLNVTVYDSGMPGLQVYEVDGGTKYVYQVATQQLAQEGATEAAEQQGTLVEQTITNGVEIVANGAAIFTETWITHYGYTVVPVFG